MGGIDEERRAQRCPHYGSYIPGRNDRPRQPHNRCGLENITVWAILHILSAEAVGRLPQLIMAVGNMWTG